MGDPKMVDLIANSLILNYLQENGFKETFNQLEGLFSTVDIGDYKLDDLVTEYVKENEKRKKEMGNTFNSSQDEKVVNGLVLDYLSRLGQDDIAADLGECILMETWPGNHRLENLVVWLRIG